MASGKEGDQGRTLRCRAAFLCALGVLNLVVRPGHIPLVYGVAFLLAPALRGLPASGILMAAAGLVAVFPPVADAGCVFRPHVSAPVPAERERRFRRREQPFRAREHRFRGSRAPIPVI